MYNDCYNAWQCYWSEVDLLLDVVLVHVRQSRTQQRKVWSVAQRPQQAVLSTRCVLWIREVIHQLFQHSVKTLCSNKPQKRLCMAITTRDIKTSQSAKITYILFLPTYPALMPWPHLLITVTNQFMTYYYVWCCHIPSSGLKVAMYEMDTTSFYCL